MLNARKQASSFPADMLQYAALIDSSGVEKVQRVEAAGLDRHFAFGVVFMEM